MSTLTISRQQTLNVHDCINCGVTFAITVELETRRRADHQSFYCPNGHGQAWNGPSKAEREARDAKAKADLLEQQLASRNEDLRDERLSHAATKGQLTKAKKRADAALCPHCNRSFVQVRRHIASQHPGSHA